ncbi:O-antigen translocase [Pseudomonas sp. Z2-11]
MTLLRTSLLNGIAVLVKMLTLLGINKVLAIYVGPSGYAAVGQLQNAIQMLTVFASGAINTGVTKYTAEFSEEDKLLVVWRTAGSITILGSAVTGVVVALCSSQLALYFLGSVEYRFVFLCLASTLFMLTLNSLFLAILNGKKDIRRYVVANIAGSILALCITSVLAMLYGLYGALIALTTYQAMAFFVTIMVCKGAEWFSLANFIGSIDKTVAANLGKFALMTLVSAICAPLAQIVIRNHLSMEFGVKEAGYWEAMWRLSAAYLMFVTTTLSVYFLPRLSEINNARDLRAEILQSYKLILPAVMLASVVIFFLRDFVIATLFTTEFAPIRDYFGWQLLGDTLKIGGWILAYLMLGKAMYKPYIVAELIYAVGFVGLTFLFTGWWGADGVAIAHAAIYVIYWLVVGWATYPTLRESNQKVGGFNV